MGESGLTMTAIGGRREQLSPNNITHLAVRRADSAELGRVDVAHVTPAEEWRRVPAELGPYEVSDRGRVRSRRVVYGVVRGRVLKQRRKGRYSYACVGHGRGGHRWVAVHRLVALAFHGSPTEARTEVDHIDRDPTNNAATNLRWVTRAENAANRGAKAVAQ